MSYKPSDFFVDVTDFFGVLLPGALITFYVKNSATAKVFNGKLLPEFQNAAEGWVAFIFASYILGHMIATLGGFNAILADKILEPIFNRFKGKAQQLRTRAEYVAKISFKHYGSLEPDVQKAYVRLKDAATGAKIDRMHAIARFFRTLATVLLIFFIAHYTKPITAFVAFILWAFFVFLYSYQRYRHKTLINACFIALQLEKIQLAEIENKHDDTKSSGN